MEQINAIVDVRVDRLDLPLRPFMARVGHSFVAHFRSVPADVTGLFIRVFRAHDAYYDVSANEHKAGGWTVRIPSSCFGEVGEFHYEIHATAADGQPTAIGSGRIVVDPFTTTTTPIMPGTIQEVAQLPCEGGGFVQVVMKWDGYAWVQEAVYNAATNDEEVE